VPSFDEGSARRKVKAAQDAWNTRDPEKASLAYTLDSRRRNRDEFFGGLGGWTTGWRRTCGASRGAASR
jgi:nuclear transport factor 2 (NTF2) superfamily protein